MPIVVGADGTAIETDDAGALASAQLNGNHVATPEEAKQLLREADLTKRYGTGLGQVEGVAGPLAAGALRGATFGLSDIALSKFGGDAVRQRLQDYQDFNTIEGNAGEIAGLAGATALGGGLGAIGRGAEGLATRALGEGILGRVVGGAASGAIENGLYAAGREAGDLAIRDEAITGEKLTAAGYNGAIFGGAIGGGMGFLGSMGGKALAREKPSLALEAGEAIERPQAGSLGEYLAKQGDVNTIKALGGSAGDIRNIERNVKGGYRRVAQDINADLEATTGKSIGFHDKESLHEYATKRLEEVNKTQAALITELDNAKTGLAPKPEEFAKRATDELISPHIVAGADGGFAVLPGQEKSVNAVGGWIKRVEDAFNSRQPTFSEWRKMRIGLDNEIKYNQVNVTPETAALKQLRAIMEDEFSNAGERASQSMGSTFKDQYQANKQLTQSLIKAEELTNRGVSRELVNNSFGLRASMGAIAGVASGNPLLGVAAGVAGKVIKDRGDFFAADLYRRASTLSGVSRLANGVTESIQDGVRKLVPSGAKMERVVDSARIGGSALGVKLSGNRRADFQKVSSQVAQASSSPDRVADRVSRSMGDLSTQAPKTAAAIVQTTMTGLAYLSSLLPPTRADKFSLQPQLDTRNPSDVEIARFMRAAQAVDNPLMVLQEAKQGKLSRDHVDAVKTVYPALYEEMKGKIFEQLVTSKKKLSYAQQVQMSILLDQPTNRTLDNQFIQAIQGTYTPAESSGQATMPDGQAPDLAGSFQTSTQSATERIQ